MVAGHHLPPTPHTHKGSRSTHENDTESLTPLIPTCPTCPQCSAVSLRGGPQPGRGPACGRCRSLLDILQPQGQPFDQMPDCLYSQLHTRN